MCLDTLGSNCALVLVTDNEYPNERCVHTISLCTLRFSSGSKIRGFEKGDKTEICSTDYKNIK